MVGFNDSTLIRFKDGHAESLDNLISLLDRCHNTQTDRESFFWSIIVGMLVGSFYVTDNEESYLGLTEAKQLMHYIGY